MTQPCLMAISDLTTKNVVTRDELLVLGLSTDEIRSALDHRELVSLHRGVYSVGERSTAALTGLRIHGVARQSPSMVLSHASAAVLHRIPLWRIDPDVVHLTAERRGPSGRPPGRVVHAAALAADEVMQCSGLAVTSPARTLVDLARSSGFESAVIACDWALHEGLVTPAELLAALESAHHRPGRRSALRALSFADGRAESPGESRLRVLMHRAGLDAPELQIDVRDRIGTLLGRSDLGYPDESALIEFDGKVKYQKLLLPGQSATDVVIAEKRREEEVRAVGASMLRVVWKELERVDWLLDRIASTREQGRTLRRAGVTTGTLVPRPAIRLALP